MTAFKGTPGPWYAGEQSEISGWVDISIPGYSRNSVAFATPATSGDAEARRDPETLANARLIAAAPELLEACRQALTFVAAWAGVYQHNHGLRDFHPRHKEAIEQVKSAIAKATGGQA